MCLCGGKGVEGGQGGEPVGRGGAGRGGVQVEAVYQHTYLLHSLPVVAKSTCSSKVYL